MQITNRLILKHTLILAIFLASMYIGSLIKFFNNDDWVHYKTVENFLSQNFQLHPYIGSTFFTQGLLSSAFATLFGIGHLPVLTILISLVGLFIFYETLKLTPSKNFGLKFITLFLVILNPLYLYSSIGFMTENYVILFMLLGIYFHLKFQSSQKARYLFPANISYILGFFVKHYTIFLNFASIIYFTIKQKWLDLIGTSLLTITLLIFYYFIFPRNDVLTEQSINFDLRNMPTLLLNILLYLSLFTLPLSLFLIFRLKTHRLMTLLLFGIILFINFKLLNVSDFPSLPNVLTRKGLFPDIDGNKSHWTGYHRFFTYTFYTSITISSILSAKLILAARYIFDRNKFLSIAVLLYLGLCLILPYFYDRYLLPLLILWILISYRLLAGRNINILGLFIATLWMLVYFFFNYLYISDFIVRNMQISKATDGLIINGINPQAISANRSWNSYYGVSSDNIDYIFSYDNPDVFDAYRNFALDKTLEVDFPLNLFIDKKIYLYKVNEN